MYENAIDTIPKKYGKYYRTKNLKEYRKRAGKKDNMMML